MIADLIKNIDLTIKELKKIDPNKMVGQIFRENEAQLIDTNLQEQLYLKGEKADGSFLPAYSPTTVFLKKSGDGDKRIENMTLKDQGDLYKGTKVTYLKDQYLFDSTDDKAEKLKYDYGQIFGLTDKNLQEHIKKLFLPEMIRMYQEQVNNALNHIR